MKLNKELVEVSEVTEDVDVRTLRSLIEEHTAATHSPKGQMILDHFSDYLPNFKKIIPHDYKRIIEDIARLEGKGLSPDEAKIEAFYNLTNEQ